MYSIAAALAQADEFLRSRPWTRPDHVQHRRRGQAGRGAGEPGAAAVASARVAAIYGLDVIADVDPVGQRQPDPVRRDHAPRGEGAVRAAASPAAVAGAPRTTLVFAVRNVPGSLHRSLEAFASRGINLSRLESRPGRTAARAGSTCSGWTWTGTRRTRLRGRPGGAARRDRGGPAPGHLSTGRRGLIRHCRPARCDDGRRTATMEVAVDEAFRIRDGRRLPARRAGRHPRLADAGRRGPRRTSASRSPCRGVNRHGLIAGATGTGKTKTLQLIAGQLSAPACRSSWRTSRATCPGVGAPGDPANPKIAERCASLGWTFEAAGHPVELLSLSGTRGAQVRATVSLVRAAAAGQGAGPQRDADLDPVARLPLLRRQGPAAAGPRGPAHDAQVPRLGRGQARPRGPTAACRTASRRRAPALDRRPSSRRAPTSSSASPSSTWTTCCARRPTGSGVISLLELADVMDRAAAVLDVHAVDAGPAVREPARGRRPAQAEAVRSSSTRRTCCSTTRPRR